MSTLLQTFNRHRFTVLSWAVTILIVIALLGVTAWWTGRGVGALAGPAAPAQAAPADPASIELPPSASSQSLDISISRGLALKTNITGQTNTEPITYRVMQGDSLFAIAEPEDRPYRAHLTLGRVKVRRHLQLLQEAVLRRQDFQAEAFDVTEVVLYRSELRPEGARYTALFRAPLGAVSA